MVREVLSWCGAVGLIVGAVVWSYLTQQVPYANTLEEARSATVFVATGEGSTQTHGTGVVVLDGLVLTAAHVVTGDEPITITYLDGSEATATVLWSTGTPVVGEPDLALLAVDTFDTVPVTMNCEAAVEVGDFITSIGNPRYERWVVGPGMVATYEDHTATYAVTMPIAPGWSGGGVFDDAFKLVGIAHTAPMSYHPMIGAFPEGSSSFGAVQSQATICRAFGIPL